MHRITPFELHTGTNSDGNAGANQAFEQAAEAAELTGVIPLTKGGNVTDGGPDVAVCDATEKLTADDSPAN